MSNAESYHTNPRSILSSTHGYWHRYVRHGEPPKFLVRNSPPNVIHHLESQDRTCKISNGDAECRTTAVSSASRNFLSGITCVKNITSLVRAIPSSSVMFAADSDSSRLLIAIKRETPCTHHIDYKLISQNKLSSAQLRAVKQIIDHESSSRISVLERKKMREEVSHH